MSKEPRKNHPRSLSHCCCDVSKPKCFHWLSLVYPRLTNCSLFNLIIHFLRGLLPLFAFQKVILDRASKGGNSLNRRPAGSQPAGRRTKNEIGRASWEHRAVSRFRPFGTHRTGRPIVRCPPDVTIFRTHTAGGQPADFII